MTNGICRCGGKKSRSSEPRRGLDMKKEVLGGLGLRTQDRKTKRNFGGLGGARKNPLERADHEMGKRGTG